MQVSMVVTPTVGRSKRRACPAIFRATKGGTPSTPANPAAGVPPVVDPRNQQAENDEPDRPGTDLAVNRMTVNAPPALSIVEHGPDQPADRRRRSNGVGNAGQVGDQESEGSAGGVDDHHAVGAVFAHGQKGQLPESRHVEKDVQNTAVQIIGRQKAPPAPESVDGDGSGHSQQK